MKFLVDNNLPPALAHALAALCKTQGEDVESVTALRDRFPQATDDLVWLADLAKDANPWYVVTIDKFKKRAGAERRAISAAGHTVYVLDKQWAKQPFWAKAANLVLWWPDITRHARLTSGGVFRVRWRHGAQNKFEAM